LKYFWHLLELFYAWRRSERRIAPVGATGRVYARINDDATSPSSMVAKASPVGTISAKVIRADGRVEDLGVIGNVERKFV
jgi:hypothetical protein